MPNAIKRRAEYGMISIIMGRVAYVFGFVALICVWAARDSEGKRKFPGSNLELAGVWRGPVIDEDTVWILFHLYSYGDECNVHL